MFFKLLDTMFQFVTRITSLVDQWWWDWVVVDEATFDLCERFDQKL